MMDKKRMKRMRDGITFDDIWNAGKEGVVCRECGSELRSETMQRLKPAPDYVFMCTYRCQGCGKPRSIRVAVDD